MDGRILRKVSRTGETRSTQIVRQEFAKGNSATHITIIHSRPLVYVGDDNESNISLTPGNFLTMKKR